MQELYEDLEEFKSIANNVRITDIQNIIEKHYLDKEKAQIKDAWLSAWKDSMLEPLEDKFYEPEAEEYFKETYLD